MKKRIIIFLLTIVAFSGGWYLYVTSKATKTGAPEPTAFKDFFPFGTAIDTNPDGTLPENTDNTIPSPSSTTSLFKQVSPGSVAGYSSFLSTTSITVPATTPKGKPTKQIVTERVVRYVSRTSGYVYEIKDGQIPTQISNIYVPNIYEALFADAGKTALLRFLREDTKTIATYSLPIPDPNTDGTRTQKNGMYLPDGIPTLAVSPDGTAIARLTFDSKESILSTSTTTNASRKELIRSPFREWLVSWGGQKNIYLQSKASGTTDGFLYVVDTTKRRLVRILGDIQGLTTSVSPGGTYVLYSETTATGVSTKLLTTRTGVTRIIGNNIFPEKCAWLKNEDLICAGGGTLPTGVYPDDWYKGTKSFSDQIVRIYSASNTFDILHQNTDGESFDMTNLQVDESTNTLYFIDKPTGVLWKFTL